ncbi:DUF4328 domain-containing protein [Yinghuangia seranimata]|uniref:DUF4328 domain-containing protein n=1 Tax=Yinghuangia seranimata TaxID=408067 RepID=UPI00248BBE83|nr:DUF4328 domain-containing protein [Yinghuangia seranimata]MDI2132825.1 DUF4328 domain-containing protein [Yinghuangia seranimata]
MRASGTGASGSGRVADDDPAPTARKPIEVVVVMGAAAVAALLCVVIVDVDALTGMAFDGRPPGYGGVPWSYLVGLTCIVFAAWFALARHNAPTYGPTGPRVSTAWAVAGWFTPTLCLVLPLIALVDTLAGTRARGTAPSRLPRPARRLLGAWWAVWLALWAAVFVSVRTLRSADERGLGSTTACYASYAVLHVLSAVAALGMAGYVAYVTGVQFKRRAEPVREPVPTPPPGRRVGVLTGLALTGALLGIYAVNAAAGHVVVDQQHPLAAVWAAPGHTPRDLYGAP